jgi:hypothetical protein
MDEKTWLAARKYTLEEFEIARSVLAEIQRGRPVHQTMSKYPLPGGGYLPKQILVAIYKHQVESGSLSADPALLSEKIKPAYNQGRPLIFPPQPLQNPILGRSHMNGLYDI